MCLRPRASAVGGDDGHTQEEDKEKKRKEKKRKEKKRKEKKRKDYTFRRQFNEKPSIIPGCLGRSHPTCNQQAFTMWIYSVFLASDVQHSTSIT